MENNETQRANAENVCLNCGAILQKGQEFCTKCGQKNALPLEQDANPEISQLNIVDNKTTQAKKKKIVIIFTSVFAVAVIIIIAIVFVPKLFVSVEDLCAEGNYAEAYEKADSNERREIKAENTFAYICGRIKDDVFAGEDYDFTLLSARYLSEDLAEAFNGFHYYFLTIDQDGQLLYILYVYSEEDDEIRYIFGALDLIVNDDDESHTAFWKEVLSAFVNGGYESSYELEEEAVNRINELIANGLISNIKLSDDMRLD